jgi:hypothetical protein
MESTEPVRDKWRSVANNVTELRFQWILGNFLASWKGINPQKGSALRNLLRLRTLQKILPKSAHINPPDQHRYSSESPDTFVTLDVAEETRRPGPIFGQPALSLLLLHDVGVSPDITQGKTKDYHHTRRTHRAHVSIALHQRDKTMISGVPTPDTVHEG